MAHFEQAELTDGRWGIRDRDNQRWVPKPDGTGLISHKYESIAILHAAKLNFGAKR